MSHYFRLSNFYFFYFAFFGALIPYMGLYYQSLGFNAVEIGQLLAVFIGAKIVAPNVFGWLADRSGYPIFWVRICVSGAWLASLGLVIWQDFWHIFISVLAFSFFFHGALPQFESFTFSRLKDQKSRYGRIRLWGSVGFIVAVVLLGWAFEWVSVQVLPWVLWALLGAMLLSSFTVRDGEKQVHPPQALKLHKIIARPEVLGLLVISLLINVSHGAYYSFYSIHLTEVGYSPSAVAWLWSLGVLAEIGIFLWMGHLFQRVSQAWLMWATLGLTSLRWLLIPYFSESVLILMFAQLLHALSYGLFHALAISMTDRYFHGRYQGQGQALYAAVSHGLGGALGMLMAGYLWHYGGAVWAFNISAAMAFLALLIAFKTCRMAR